MDRMRMLGAAALLLTACEEKKRNAPLADQTASITVVSAADGGQSTNAVMIGNTDAFPLPSGDEPAVGRQPEMRAAGVYLVRLADGYSRPAYLGTVSLFFGPRMAPGDALGPITFLDGAVTGWAEPALRAKILQVARERARGEAPELLVAVADHAGSEWREAFLALSLEERALVQHALAPVLDGARPECLLAAALTSDLSTQAEAVAQRVSDLGTRGDHVATAILLGALPASRVRAALSCRMLAEATALPYEDPLLAAALLALPPKDAACLESVRTIVVRDACGGDARCLREVRLDVGGESRNPCSHDAARDALTRESRRSKWEIAAAPAAPTTALGLAVLFEAGAVAPALAAACRRVTER